MNANLEAMVGHSIRYVKRQDYSWSFVFTNEALIVTEGCWRFVTPDGIVVTSEDHEQQFGLPKPVDAGERVMSRVAGSPVVAAFIYPQTGDLTVQFADLELQFLQLSGGYEAWRFRLGTAEIICGGGGRLIIPSDEDQYSAQS